MGDGASVWVLMGTMLALVLTPGADTVYVVTRGIGEGRRIALIGSVGLCSGYVVHAVLAAVGVSAVIASSHLAFTTLRWVGVAYLVYLGVKVLRDREGFDFSVPRQPTSARQAIRQGMLTSLLNPKGLLFFLSILPQFVGTHSGVGTILGLGLLLPAMCLLVYSGWAIAAGTLGDRLGDDPRFGRILRYGCGSILVALGGGLAAGHG